MNKKGQALVLFVIMIPLVIFAFTYVFDIASLEVEKVKVKNIVNEAYNYIQEEDYDKVKNYVEKNDKGIEIIELSKDKVHVKKEVEPYFIKILGFKNFVIDEEYKK